jgi:hypothetical protein
MPAPHLRTQQTGWTGTRWAIRDRFAPSKPSGNRLVSAAAKYLVQEPKRSHRRRNDKPAQGWALNSERMVAHSSRIMVLCALIKGKETRRACIRGHSPIHAFADLFPEDCLFVDDQGVGLFHIVKFLSRPRRPPPTGANSSLVPWRLGCRTISMLPCLRSAELFTNSNFVSRTASKIS